MRPGDLVSVVRVSRGSGIMEQFSMDPDFVRAAVRQMVWRPPWEPIRASAIAALMRVVRGLGAFPGKKSVVWIGPGIRWDEENGNPEYFFREVSDLANRCSVTIHAVHAEPLPFLDSAVSSIGPLSRPGRTVPSAHAGLAGGAAGAVPSSFSADYDYFKKERFMIELADRTGGVFLPFTNHLADQFRTAAADSEGYYLLGWYPGSAAFSPGPDHKPAYHQLKIEVKKNGFIVRSRRGYFGTTGSFGPAPPSFSEETQAVDALYSPFQSGDIGVRLTASLEWSGAGEPAIRSLLHIQAPGIYFVPAATPDCSIANLEFLASPLLLDWRAQDQPQFYWRQSRLQVCGEARRQAVNDGLAAAVTTPIKRPGAYQMRIAVRNLPPDWKPRSSAAKSLIQRDSATPVPIPVGSANELIEAPDVSKAKLILAGLSLSSANAPSEKPADVIARLVSPGDPAVRVFHKSETLVYAFRLYQRVPVTETHMELLRDGRVVYTSDPLNVPAGSEFRGVWQLDPAIVSGHYIMRVRVQEKGKRSRDSEVSQAIDFEVLN